MVKCDEWDDYAADMERRKLDAHRRRFAQVEWKTEPEGFRVWGDDLRSVQRAGGNWFVRVREDDE